MYLLQFSGFGAYLVSKFGVLATPASEIMQRADPPIQADRAEKV
jgi:hypothetical protein